MAAPQPARLYQKKSGVFFIRVLLATTAASRADKASKKELRCTLRTKSLLLARTVCSYLNALLETTPVRERATTVSKFLSHQLSTWTLPGGLSASDEDDQERLLRFLAQKPEIEQAIVQAIKQSTSADPRMLGLLARLAESRQDASSIGVPTALARTMHLDAAINAYAARYNDRLKSQNDRTSEDNVRLLKNFKAFINKQHPELVADPLVHTIETRHVDAFLAAEAERPGRGQRQSDIDASEPAEDTAGDEDDQASPIKVKALTLLKKLGGLNHFFNYLLGIEKVVSANPAADMKDAAEVWRKRASEEEASYAPFSGDQLKRMFEPAFYLAHTRDPDHFWAPLLGVHLGSRLGEFINKSIDCVGEDVAAGCWYIDITVGKNKNSVRRLPITQPLVDLGFLRYVEHVRALGGKYLFPHRNWKGSTATRQPSKGTSRRFGENLTELGMIAHDEVFHSFRHTVITLLSDAGVPLTIAMQICGHEAQDHAVREGEITKEEATSVHRTIYTHPDQERPGTDHPILKLKAALEQAVVLPLDYERLARCAEIVRTHLKPVGGSFRSGWAAQNEKYTRSMVDRLARSMAHG
jgi:integrase